LRVRALWQQPNGTASAAGESSSLRQGETVPDSDFGTTLPAAVKTVRIIFQSQTRHCCLAVRSADVPERRVVLDQLTIGPGTVQLAGFLGDVAPAEGVADTCDTDPPGVGHACAGTGFATASFESASQAVEIAAGSEQVVQVPVQARPFLLNLVPVPDGSYASPVPVAFTVTDAVNCIRSDSIKLDAGPTATGGNGALVPVACDDSGWNTCGDGDRVDKCSPGGDLNVHGFSVFSPRNFNAGIANLRIQAVSDTAPPRALDVAYSFTVLPPPSPSPGPFDFALDDLQIDGNVGNAGNSDGTLDFVDPFDDGSISTPPTSCFSFPQPIEESGGFLRFRSQNGTRVVSRFGVTFQEIDGFLDACPDLVLLQGAGKAQITANFRADPPAAGQFYGIGVQDLGAAGAPSGAAATSVDARQALATDPSIKLSDVVAAAQGQQVTISATLSAGGAQVAGTQSTITFDNTKVTLNLKANGKPDCTVNPAINKGGTAFALQPAGCSGSACTGVKALVLALDNTDAIPDGSVLFTCKVNIAASASGTSTIAISGVELSDPNGHAVSGATGVNGTITISGGGGSPTPTTGGASPTPTTGGATATPTTRPTPSGPALIVDIVNASPGQQVALGVTLFAGGDQVAGTQSTLTFDNTNVTLNLKSNGKADCTVNPDIDKGGTAFALQPPGCSGSTCNAVKALVLALDNTDVIPDGSVLYTCNVNVAATASGTSTITISGVGMSDPNGAAVPGVIGQNGAVIAGSTGPTSTPTNTAPTVVVPTNTPPTVVVATNTPTMTPTPRPTGPSLESVTVDVVRGSDGIPQVVVTDENGQVLASDPVPLIGAIKLGLLVDDQANQVVAFYDSGGGVRRDDQFAFFLRHGTMYTHSSEAIVFVQGGQRLGLAGTPSPTLPTVTLPPTATPTNTGIPANATPTNTGIPASATATKTGVSPSATFTASTTPSATPSPTPSVPSINLGTATGAPGTQVTFAATLSAAGASVAGTQNDIAFDAVNIPVARDASGNPVCAVNPDINKNGTSFALQPAGCSGSGCTGVTALVLALDNTDPIADGKVLYTCRVNISAAAAPGVYPLTISRVHMSDPSGAPIPGATGHDGEIIVTGTPTPGGGQP
jgi:hypothetical protein